MKMCEAMGSAVAAVVEDQRRPLRVFECVNRDDVPLVRDVVAVERASQPLARRNPSL